MNLIGHLGTALLEEDLLFNSCYLAEQVHLVEKSHVLDYVAQEGLFFDVMALAVEGKQHLDDGLPSIEEVELRLCVHCASEDRQLVLVRAQVRSEVAHLLQVVDEVAGEGGLTRSDLALDD